MDDNQNPKNEPPAAAAEPVRSRWTPKPEQILILESIFNSGMVNPPKDETVRIRKLLENFGTVGDANVFYWFQNRRSRSRRRQRQIQASLASSSSGAASGGSMALYDQAAAASCSSNCTSSSSSGFSGGGAGFGYASSSSGFGEGYKADDLFSVSSQMRGFGEESYGTSQFMSSYEAAPMPYQAGSITVFINGVQTEVPIGAIDIRAMFGDDVMLVHSSGEPLPMNEHGILLQSLQMGESYYLVGRPT